MAVKLGSDVLFEYRRFTLYNSPYVAHDSGCAIDLYPEGSAAPSPVSGTVRETRAVDAPPKPYAAEQDHLILVDTGEYVARLLHVEPWVEPGDEVSVSEPIGDLVRAGFFAPWVPNHIHLGYRTYEQNPYRAAGSLRIEAAIDLLALDWDGTGTVIETGETWATLDEPAHPEPGAVFAGLGSDGGVLDGGFPHYACGGLLGGGNRAVVGDTEIGAVSGRDVSWDDCTVHANGDPVTGIALFCSRDSFGIKLVGESIDLQVGDEVAVTVQCRS